MSHNGARVSVVNGETRISTAASLAFDGTHDRRCPGYISSETSARDWRAASIVSAWFELNVLGLNVGVDAAVPALKLPGIGRLGPER